MRKGIITFGLTFFLSLIFLCDSYAEEKAHVIVLHGIARSSSSMEDISNFLTKKGYDVSNIDYQSTDHTLEKLTEQLYTTIADRINNPAQKIHIVCYSMGCLLTRALIHQHRPANLGRVVMIGPPNGGSEVADFLKDNLIYQKVYGPAGQQLTTEQTEIKDFIGSDMVDYEVGIIAGDWTIDPISSLIIPGEDDGKVAVKNTKLAGAKDHIVIHAVHTFIIQADEAMEQTNHFLQYGKFDYKALE